MTIKELIELLKLHDENKIVKMVYDGPESLSFIDIEAVEEKSNFVFIDSSKYESQG